MCVYIWRRNLSLCVCVSGFNLKTTIIDNQKLNIIWFNITQGRFLFENYHGKIYMSKNTDKSKKPNNNIRRDIDFFSRSKYLSKAAV